VNTGSWRPGTDNRHLGREVAPVGAHSRHLDSLVEDARLPGGQVACETLPMRLAQRGRHDDVREFPADHLISPVAEDVFERAAHVRHASAPVDADDRVEGGFEDRALPRSVAEVLSEHVVFEVE